jgi:quercetin dioxygenase-like cupin family protein
MKQILQRTIMKAAPVKQTVVVLAVALAIGIALGVIGTRVLSAQQTPPTKAKGQTQKKLVSLELGPQIPELQGYYLRARINTYEPDGHNTLHNHKDRPVIVYILQGTLTSCSPDGKCEELHEGRKIVEGEDVTHWAENRGTRPAVNLVVDISKEP